MFRRVRQHFGMRGVFKDSHEHEQRGRGFIIGPTDHLRQCLDLLFAQLVFNALRYLRELDRINRVDEAFTRISA